MQCKALDRRRLRCHCRTRKQSGSKRDRFSASVANVNGFRPRANEKETPAHDRPSDTEGKTAFPQSIFFFSCTCVGCAPNTVIRRAATDSSGRRAFGSSFKSSLASSWRHWQLCLPSKRAKVERYGSSFREKRGSGNLKDFACRQTCTARLPFSQLQNVAKRWGSTIKRHTQVTAQRLR